MQEVKILIAGDLVPTESNMSAFETADIDRLICGEIKEQLRYADFRIYNLEVPLTNTKIPIDKSGPALSASEKSIAGIKDLGADVLGLANNHILDQGEQGLFNTIRILQENEIDFVGAGKNITEASRGLVVDKNGVKICIYACAENEFTIADEYSAGANPFDPLCSLDHILELKSRCDHLIVLYHGGKEHYRYPSPYLQKVCRRMAGKGADVIVCQHSHCIGAREDYNSSVIIYGQGNFIFDLSESDFWQTSLLIELKIIDKKILVNEIPIVKNGSSVRLADIEENKRILMEYKTRSLEIQEAGFVSNRYNVFATSLVNDYLNSFFGNHILIRIINRLLGRNLSKLLHSQKSLLWFRNMAECEAHREIFISGIKTKMKKGV